MENLPSWRRAGRNKGLRAKWEMMMRRVKTKRATVTRTKRLRAARMSLQEAFLQLLEVVRALGVSWGTLMARTLQEVALQLKGAQEGHLARA